MNTCRYRKIHHGRPAVGGRQATGTVWADGCFFYAVKTTGVYCRPTCSLPDCQKRVNVRFFLTCGDAEPRRLSSLQEMWAEGEWPDSHS